MDQKSSRLPKDKHESRSPGQQQNRHYEMYDEAVTQQKKIEKKMVHYKRGHPVEKDLSSDAPFQIPESDRNVNLAPYPGYNYSRSCKGNEKQPVGQLEEDSDPNSFPNNSSSFRRSHNPKIQQLRNYEKEAKQLNYDTPLPTVEYRDPNQELGYQEKEIGKHSSLICKALNYDGEPLTVNDQVIRNKLILSCRPRRYYGTESFLNKQIPTDIDHPLSYRYSPSQPSGYDDVTIQRTTDVQYQQNIPGHPYSGAQPYKENRTYTGTGKPILSRMDTYDLGNLGIGEHGGKETVEQIRDNEKEGEKYKEQYKTVQCKRYTRNFIKLLWALLIISTLLVLVGLALLLLTLIHFLFHDYINIVIGQEGYVNWLWGTMILSLCIIIVGVYGMITAITRSKRMLLMFYIAAAVLIFIIIIYILIFWLVDSNLKKEQNSAMVSTFNQYRCNRWVHQAWDTMHERYQCCGVHYRGDWKYIPPSCCHAETKFQKIACINHFIQEDQAYKVGCRTKLEDYFKSIFFLITCFLLFAIILLVLGILAALRLLKMYKIVLKCRETYFITP